MTPTPEKVSVTTLTDLVEVVPTLLGFHPVDSLVLLVLERDRIVVTARADLEQPEPLLPWHAFAKVWGRTAATEAIGIAFTPDRDRAWWALDGLDDAVPGGVQRLLVHADGQRWSVHPDDQGEPYDALASVHLARAAFAGRPVRRSREELRSLIEPDRAPGEVSASLQRIAASEDGLTDLIGSAHGIVATYDPSTGPLSIDDATLLCLASHDPDFLDEVLIETSLGNAAARVELWAQVVRSSVPSCAGGALVALALAAWVAGNGALQMVCLEALAGRNAPGEWLRWLQHVNAEALAPTAWEVLRADLRGREAS